MRSFILSIVGDVPDTGGGAKERLVSVEIKFRIEYVFDRIYRIDWIDAGVLVQRASRRGTWGRS